MENIDPQKVLQLKQAVLREQFKRSFYEFFKYFWSVLEAHELAESEYLKYVCGEVLNIFRWVEDWETQREARTYDLLLNIAPGTSKSSIISKFGLVYLWVLNPDIQVISSSYASAPVKEFTSKFKKLLNSDEFTFLYPELSLVEDNVNKQKNNFKGARYTTSTGGSVTGMHADLIVVDDHNKPPTIIRDENGNIKLNQGATLTEILSGNAWHDDVLVTRQTDKEYSRSIYVQQRVHRQDLSGYLLKKAEKGAVNLKHIVLPAEINMRKQKLQAYSRIYIDGKIVEEKDLSYLYSKDGLLDPVRMKRKILEKKKNLMGSYTYNAQYQQKPSKDKGGLIKPIWFPTINASELPTNLVKYFYSDTSEGKATSDNMATICWSLYEGKMYVWEIMAVVKPFNEYIGHHDESGKYIDKQYDLFVKGHGQNAQSKHFFEAKSSGSSYMQYINSITPYNAIADNPIGSKVDRVNVTSGRMQSGRVVLVRGDAVVDHDWIDNFLEEASNFTGKDGDPDDRVDVLTGAVKLTDFRGSSYIRSRDADSNKKKKTEDIHF